MNLTAGELLDFAARVQASRPHLHAAARTEVVRDMRLLLQARGRTYDRLGSRPFLPGDSARLLVVRDLLTRGQLTVRTYQALAEIHVLTVLDCGLGLLGHAETGPFAALLAFGLVGAGAWRKQPSALAFLDAGGRPPTPVVTRFAQLGALVPSVIALRPEALPAEQVVARLHRILWRPPTNTNLFLVLRAGLSLPILEDVLRLAEARTHRVVAFPVLAADELDPVSGPLVEPDTGAALDVAADHTDRLVAYLDAMVALGRRLGVVVEPLLVRDYRADLEALLPLLGGL
jgi:hypothetical protein